MKKRSTLVLLAPLVLSALGCQASLGNAVEHDNVAFDVSPDGQKLVFSCPDGDLYLLSFDTRRVERLTKTENIESTPAFSPDGGSIVYSLVTENHEGASLFIRSLEDNTVRRLTNDGDVSDSMPSYSRDGKRITFIRAHQRRPYVFGGSIWDHCDVYAINSDGTGLRRLSWQNYYQAVSPRFVHNDDGIIYAAETVDPISFMTIFSINTETPEQPKQLKAPSRFQAGFSAWGSDPSPSPGGDRVVFVSDRASHFLYDLYVMNLDGTNVHQIGASKISKYNKNPVFTPDGKSILFLAGTEVNRSNRPIFSLWKVDLDGKDSRRLSQSGLFTDPVHWNPTR